MNSKNDLLRARNCQTFIIRFGKCTLGFDMLIHKCLVFGGGCRYKQTKLLINLQAASSKYPREIGKFFETNNSVKLAFQLAIIMTKIIAV
jgi:hypothetical protein